MGRRSEFERERRTAKVAEVIASELRFDDLSDLAALATIKTSHVLGGGALAFAMMGRAFPRAPPLQEFCKGRASAASRLPARASIHVGRPGGPT